MGERGERKRAMAELTDDLIIDIIWRIPVKSILRFRCVCKYWCALIDSNDFVKQHLNHSIKTKTNHTIIFEIFNSVNMNSLDQALKLVEPINLNQWGATLLGSCNGLLCLFYKYFEENLIIIWNPATKKHVKLPCIDDDLVKGPYYVFVYGFGNNCVFDDYKVVTVLRCPDYNNNYRSETYVYNLRSKSWRKSAHTPDYLISNNQRAGTLLCGAIHWIVTKPGSPFIAAFDLAMEEYKIVTFPDNSHDRGLSLFLSELGGCLSIACYYPEVGVFDVWVMKDYGVRESWTKLLIISDSEIVNYFESAVIPLTYSKNGDEILLKSRNERLICYNLEKRTAKCFDFDGIPNSLHHVICLESLVSLGAEAEND